MGGSLITPDNDILGKTWLPDDAFMAHPSPAINVSYNGNIEYKQASTKYIAPTSVYSTAKAMDMNTTTTRDSNITWVFKVKKKSKYFLRFHFCDIIIKKQYTSFLFDYFVGVNRTWLDSTTEKGMNIFANPVWFELIIVTDNSGYFKMGIAHNKAAPLSRAFLNGFEMMELMEKSFVGAVDLRLKDQEKRSDDQKSVIIGICVGGFVMVSLIIGLGWYCYIIRNGKFKKRHHPFLVPQNDPSEKIMSLADLAPDLNLELKIPFKEIAAATNDFEEKKLIGVGGFGRVYVGTIGDTKVAVKRSRPGLGQGIKEFQTEIIILSQIRFRYLVSLYGYVKLPLNSKRKII